MTSEDKFIAAVEVINSIPYDGTFEPSEELLVKLHAYQMQAVHGPCNTAKPYFWDVSGKNRWSAWKNLQNMSKDIAMENYVHELTKIIETMAYNDKISKFMSLMGSFYEYLSEDTEFQSDKEVENKKENRNIHQHQISGTTAPIIYENHHRAKSESQSNENVSQNSNQILNENIPNRISNLYSSSSSSSSDLSNFDLLSDLSETFSSESDSGLPKTIQPCKSSETFQFVEKDLLVLLTLNLKSSLENIVQQFDAVNNLASTNELNMVLKNSSQNEWNFNYTAVALSLLWPIAVEFCFSPLE